MYWTTGSGRIELNISKKIASNCSHRGSCDNDVLQALQIAEIKRQLNKIPADLLAKASYYQLKHYTVTGQGLNITTKLLRLSIIVLKGF